MSASVAPDLPIWAQWFAALAVPIAAFVGASVAIVNAWNSYRLRQRQLFDARLDYLKRLAAHLEEMIKGPEGGDTTSHIELVQRKEVEIEAMRAEGAMLFRSCSEIAIKSMHRFCLELERNLESRRIASLMEREGKDPMEFLLPYPKLPNLSEIFKREMKLF